MTRILVYGTLKSGESNFHRHMHGRAVYKGHAQTLLRCFAMVACAAGIAETRHDAVYPGAVLAKLAGLPGGRLSGEVYEVGAKQLARLDRLESVGVNYDRVPVRLKDGTSAYLYLKRDQPRAGALRSPFIRWHDGAWAWSQKRGTTKRKTQQSALRKYRI